MQVLTPMKVLTLEKIEKRLAEIRDSIHRERMAIPEFRYHHGDCPGAHQSDFDDDGWQLFRVWFV